MLWEIDGAHSTVEFGVKHMMVTNVRGRFGGIEGRIEFDPQDPSRGSVEASIRADTIYTGQDYRDTHLKSPDFLDAETHPKLTFKSTKVERVDRERVKVTGDLTIRGVSRPVTFHVTLDGVERSSKESRAGFTATATIDRKQWGLNWNQALESGGLLVGDKLKIEIDIAAVAKAGERELDAVAA